MSNNSQGHALAEGQDLEAKFQFQSQSQSQSQSDPDSEAQRQQINRELSHFNIKLEADTLKSANLVDKSFEFALNCVLSHSDSTKDEIESLFRQNYQPPWIQSSPLLSLSYSMVMISLVQSTSGPQSFLPRKNNFVALVIVPKLALYSS
jgi:hypothetical protein